MRRTLVPFVGVLLLAACASPKYTYYFDHYDYNSGRKKAALEQTASNTTVNPEAIRVEASRVAIDEETLTASADENAATVAPAKKTEITAADKEAIAKKYKAMSKEERKEFRKEIKSQIKNYIKAKKSGDKGAIA